jgi:endoglucanase
MSTETPRQSSTIAAGSGRGARNPLISSTRLDALHLPMKCPRVLAFTRMLAVALTAVLFASCIPITPDGSKVPSPSGSFVGVHGALQVVDGQLRDAHGAPIQLRGVSLFWSQWSGPYYNSRTVHALAQSWHCTVVRAAMGISNPGGYLQNSDAFEKIREVVDAAVAEGIYVIIDWHEEQATTHAAEASAFFSSVARRYAATPNVIFEIYNEPNGPQWPAIKAYSQAVIGAIRSTGAKNLIIAGTSTWSQDVDVAAGDPLADKNTAYTLHFYAGTHRASLRAKAEWGTCDSSGNGNLDLVESQRWVDFMNQHRLSWCNFAFNDKAETASALTPGTSVDGPPAAGDLTASGSFVYQALLKP